MSQVGCIPIILHPETDWLVFRPPMSPNPHTDVTEVALSPPGRGGGRNSEGSDGSIGYTGNFGHTNGSSNNSGRNVRRFPFLFYCFCFILSFLVLYCLIGFSEFFFLSHRELQALPHRSSVPCPDEGRTAVHTAYMPLRTPELEQYVAEELYRAPAALCQVFQ